VPLREHPEGFTLFCFSSTVVQYRITDGLQVANSDNLNLSLNLDIWHNTVCGPRPFWMVVPRSGQVFLFPKDFGITVCFSLSSNGVPGWQLDEKSISFLHHSHRKENPPVHRRQLSARVSKAPGSRRTRRALCDCGTWFCRNITLGTLSGSYMIFSLLLPWSVLSILWFSCSRRADIRNAPFLSRSRMQFANCTGGFENMAFQNLVMVHDVATLGCAKRLGGYHCKIGGENSTPSIFIIVE
jgi:hypothetical protein